MLLEGQSMGTTVLFEERHSLIDLEIEQFTHLAPGKFAGTIPVQGQCFQGTPVGLRPIKVQWLSKFVWYFCRKYHSTAVYQNFSP